MIPGAVTTRTARFAMGASLVIAAFGVSAAAILGSEPGTLPAVAWVLLTSGLPAAAYVAGAIGLGCITLPVFLGRHAPREPALAAAFGLALMLAASHALGCLGLLAGTIGRIVAIAFVVVGLAGLAGLRHAVSRRAPCPGLVLCAPTVVIAVFAACSPPGWLWESEFGGYDALSYHLQLPQEWIASGRIAPVEHNVYSFLPSAIESAFVHVGVLLGADGPTGDGRPWGLVANSGGGLLAAQFLHLWIGVVAVALLGKLSAAAAQRSMSETATPAPQAGMVMACVASVPWVIVTATLAYNEMGVLALGAGAALAAIDARIPPVRRALVSGVLVGAACLCKPTALLFVGVPVGLLLLGLAPVRAWPAMITAGSCAGVAMLTPWLARNAIACGNPIFPFAISRFGEGWWTHEQAVRFSRAHAFQGSLADRIGLLVGVTSSPRDATRGYMNAQWGSFVIAPILAPAVALIRASGRVPSLLALGLAAQLLAWLGTTHLQSRFLLPTLLTLAPMLGIAVRPARSSRGEVTRWAATLLIVAFGIASTLIVFGSQRGGRPLVLVGPGPAIYSGEHETSSLDAPAETTLNLAHAGTRVFLLGDATPLYFSTQPLYATTWDATVLTRAIRETPDDPGAWIESLRQAGAGLVLINFAELDRLRESGWLDPSLTDARVRAIGERLAPPVEAWPRSGRYLFDLSRRTP